MSSLISLRGAILWYGELLELRLVPVDFALYGEICYRLAHLSLVLQSKDSVIKAREWFSRGEEWEKTVSEDVSRT